ncbi:hypothetical protein Tco_1361959 [Tanacetum coccineum]
MESNKSIHISNEQKNLYKVLVEAYKSDKLILDTYGDTISLKRHRDEEDKDEEPSAGSNWRSKRRRAGKEPESTGAPKEKTSKTTSKSNEGSKSQHQQENPRESFDELTDTPFDFSAFMMNRLNVETLTPKLLASPTFELMKGTCKSLVEIEYFFEKVYKETTEQLNWHNPKGQQYPHDLRRIIAVTKLQIVEWHGYKHLDWITIQRDDDKLHTFKEDNFKRLRLQDIEDVLLLLVQGKLTNLNVENVDPHGLEGYFNMEVTTSATLMPYVFLEVTKIKVKEFQRSFCHSDTERLSRSDKVLKLKYFKKDATLKLFKSTNQERYEHVGLEVTSLQDNKDYKMAKQDYAWLMISRYSKSHSSQDKGISSNLKVNDHYIKSQVND